MEIKKEITLEKIELVRDRTGVTYKESKEALENSDGNVVDAIIAIEDKIDGIAPPRSSQSKSEALKKKIKEILDKGNISKIVISKNDETVLNISLTVGILGSIIAPWGAIVGLIAALGYKCKIEFIKDDGGIIDISEKAEDFYDVAKEKAEDFYDVAKEKAEDFYDVAKEKAEDFYDVAKDKGSDLYGAAKEKGSNLYSDMKEKAPEAFDAAKEKGEEALHKAKDAASKAKDKVLRKEDVVEDLEDSVEVDGEEKSESVEE